MNNLKPIRLITLRNQADLLLKRARLSEESALKRFLKIHPFKDKGKAWLATHNSVLKLKHSYEVITSEYGFESWSLLLQEITEKDCLYNSHAIAFIHSWFRSYETAHAYHKKNGGYLLTFWNDFIVCGKEYIALLDLDDAEKWKQIGYDWHQPDHKESFTLLKERALQNYINKNK